MLSDKLKFQLHNTGSLTFDIHKTDMHLTVQTSRHKGSPFISITGKRVVQTGTALVLWASLLILSNIWNSHLPQFNHFKQPTSCTWIVLPLLL